jgi:hypothetical protein
MTSPLAPYVNSRVLVSAVGAVSIVNGRISMANAGQRLVKCFLKRAQYTGVTSGSKKIPLDSQLDGMMMPGASGDQFYYRGYALEYAIIALGGFDIENGSESGLTWLPVTTQFNFLLPGPECVLKLGNDPIMRNAQIERSSGVFGGIGIDEVIYQEMGGVPIQLTGSELQN